MQTKTLIAASILLACSTGASAKCSVALNSKTSGFFLNPTLDRVLIAKASSNNPSDPCPLKAGDEILQVNDRVIPGANAREVTSYWKALPDSAPQVFKLRRAAAELTVVVKGPARPCPRATRPVQAGTARPRIDIIGSPVSG